MMWQNRHFDYKGLCLVIKIAKECLLQLAVSLYHNALSIPDMLAASVDELMPLLTFVQLWMR